MTTVEHNTTVLKRQLTGIGASLGQSIDVINTLARRNGLLVQQTGDATEFAVATEQTDRSKTALDETSAVTAGMDQHLGGMSAAAVDAETSVHTAIRALAVVDQAEDELRQAGAGTKSVAPARDGA